jgi:hypothetical protein
MQKTEIVETNLDDLVVALSEETALYIHDKTEVYKVVGFVLAHLLNNSSAASRTSRYWH